MGTHLWGPCVRVHTTLPLPEAPAAPKSLGGPAEAALTPPDLPRTAGSHGHFWSMEGFPHKGSSHGMWACLEPVTFS